MTRRFSGARLVVASHNAGKVREIGELLAPYNVEAISAASLNLAEPEETETTFSGNALLKARAAARASQLPALADDSGLCVDALNGDPGVYSARWAGPSKDFGVAMRLVHERMAGAGGGERAHFVCALALAWPDDHAEIFEGEVHGHITWPPRGTRGFGYDPIFVADGYDITFGEMDPARKHKISHRARAFAKMIEASF
ncbi:MAG: RdgB/HAM1 family non-canonical purine NTP pyrophosphatase [Alphaproteobacteria bacterium]|nr:RdgB/HAM1 family non-canonical purine NTP pyrophosphatase [Alphaproteobacteria bacterium]